MEWRVRSAVAISSVLIFTSVLLFYLSPVHESNSFFRPVHGVKDTFHAPRENVWKELTESEAAEVYDVIAKEFAHLNLVTKPGNAASNSIYTIETLLPNKTDAGPYVFDEGAVPERWAKVVLAQMLDEEPHLVYYAVGPLPVSEKTTVVPLIYPFNSGRNHVKSPLRDISDLNDYGFELGRNISDITETLLGAKAAKGDPDSLVCFPRLTGMMSHNFILWFQFFRPGLHSGGRTLLPQGIYVKVDATSKRQADWTIGPYYYNGQLYETANDFRHALRSADFVPTPANLDGPWTDTEDFDSAPDGRELPPPVTIQPYGPRYKLDRKERFVSWFGFEFYIGTDLSRGMTLYDIRFKGDRVMYELGLQEAMAHYGGDDPMAGGQEFLDAFFGMGKNMYELVPGYDCPAYADYMDTHYHMQREKHELYNSMCVFEFTADHLLSRHSAQSSVTATRNTFLTVRAVSTVGNYDYTIDYVFYMDGSIEVKVRASGYIFAAFYATNKTDSAPEYGHKIHDAVASSMHDHVISFKADIDVAGQSNDMVRISFEPLTTSYAWDQPEVLSRNTMSLVTHPVTHETPLDWPSNGHELYIVRSSTAKNAWGQRRGYRITPGTGMGSPPHLTVRNSTALGDAARWAEHDVWVLRQKDTEPRAADPLNYLTPSDPIINFARMADGEALGGGTTTPAPVSSASESANADDDSARHADDLVLYFNLGAHHLPHSGDVPNTLMHASASSVMFVPHNFHDRDPSRASAQGVRLQLRGKRDGGGFAGEPDADGAAAAALSSSSSSLSLSSMWADLRGRFAERDTKDAVTRAKYFGATYEAPLKVPLRALEPDMAAYRAAEHDVTDLTFNGSAAGMWAVV